MLAHELRNPLAPIRNAVEVLRLRGHDQPQVAMGARHDRPPGAPTWSGWWTTCSTCPASPAARSSCSPSRSTWRRSSRTAVETSRPLIDARRPPADGDAAAEPVWVDGDPARLAQVLTNLLNNAAKYTEAGGRICADRWPARASEAVVRVRDTGVGIPPEMLARGLRPVHPGGPLARPVAGRLGIGLTLVAAGRDARRDGVGPDDGPGRGSEFVVRLPAQPGGLRRSRSATAATHRYGVEAEKR